MENGNRKEMRKTMYRLLQEARKKRLEKQPGILLGQMFEFGPKSVYRSTSKLAPESKQGPLLQDMNELQQLQDHKGTV
jgi:hypothetical protein